MSAQLTNWMEKLLHEITEGGNVARRVRLIADGTVFESWEPISQSEIDPGEWAKDAETLVAALIPELPKRRVQLLFVAEDASGATISTLPRTVTGQNASATDLGTQNGAKALGDAIASVAKTMDAVLETARKMLDYQASQLEAQNKQLAECHELFVAIKRVELEEGENENVATKVLVEQLQQASPMLMQLLTHWASGGGGGPAKIGKTVSAAVGAATKPNGGTS